MAKCLHELIERYKSARAVIQKDPESSSEYNFSVSFDLLLKHLIMNYDALSVGACAKNERAQRNQVLPDHTNV